MGAAEGAGEEVGVGSQMGGGSGKFEGREGLEGVFQGGGAVGGHQASAMHGAPSFIAEGTGILVDVIGQV